MDYPIRDAEGTHRGSRDLASQYIWRQQRAEERRALREARTTKEQLKLLDSRRGESKRERKRLQELLAQTL